MHIAGSLSAPAAQGLDENVDSSNLLADVQLASPAPAAAVKWRVKSEAAAAAGPSQPAAEGRASRVKQAPEQQPRRSSRSQAGKRSAP